jgi:acetyltransferase-like isoleucine patch superfamily enzyme
MTAKAWLLATLRPCALLTQSLGGRAQRLWSHARLSAGLTNPVPVSAVVLGKVELHGSRRILLGERLHIYPDQYWETQGSGELHIGDGVVLSRGVHLVAHATVHIGAGSMIGEYASVRDANHRRDGGPLRDAGHEAAPIVIGRGVWIGRGVAVLAGVRIGDGAVVAANAVVTRNVPAGAVVGGVPARALPKRSFPETSDRAPIGAPMTP